MQTRTEAERDCQRLMSKALREKYEQLLADCDALDRKLERLREVLEGQYEAARLAATAANAPVIPPPFGRREAETVSWIWEQTLANLRRLRRPK